MCRGIISRSQGSCTPLLHAEMKQYIHGCCRQELAPAGLAIAAAFETELDQSTWAVTKASHVDALLHSLPIPILHSSSAPHRHEDGLESEKLDTTMINHFSASDDQQSDHNNRRINRKRYNCKLGAAQKSIFSTTSSPPASSTYNSYLYTSDLGALDFLGACLFCKCPLGPGKDIYIYRGDRAFCSTECRYKHILADESLSFTTHNIDQQYVPTSSSINGSRFTHVTAATLVVLG